MMLTFTSIWKYQMSDSDSSFRNRYPDTVVYTLSLFFFKFSLSVIWINSAHKWLLRYEYLMVLLLGDTRYKVRNHWRKSNAN